MIDLDQFKKINDTYGHTVGDRVMMEIGRILRDFTRAGEAAFRLGGDEFLIIIPNIGDERGIEPVKRRLLQCFQEEFRIANCHMRPEFSLGHAIFPDDGEDIDILLQVADERLYKDKPKTREK